MIRKNRSGFTLVELLIGMGLLGLLGIGFVGFIRFSGTSLIGITSQAENNQSASHAASLIVQRVRRCNDFTVSVDGYTLTLEFDDDTSTDTDGDFDFYNDVDHIEVFQFFNTDSDLSTLVDNGINYQSVAGAAARVIVENVQKIGSDDIFEEDASNSRLVNVSYEVSTTNSNRDQRIDIVTSVYRLN